MVLQGSAVSGSTEIVYDDLSEMSPLLPLLVSVGARNCGSIGRMDGHG